MVSNPDKPTVPPYPGVDAETIATVEALWKLYQDIVRSNDPELEKLLSGILKLGEVLRRTRKRLQLVTAKAIKNK